MKDQQLTELESKIIADINQMLDDGNELIYIGDLSGEPKKVRGGLSSLVKKGIIDVNTSDGGIISLLESEYRKK